MQRTHATSHEASATIDAAAASARTQWLVCALGGTEYGLDVTRVQQIIGLLPITRVPRMPAAVRGVINLRGRVIPVIDLRVRFGLEAVDHGQRTCIIVVQTGETDLGLVVDGVAEVVHLDAAAIEDAPHFGDNVDTDHLIGVAKHGERVLLLLDVDRTLPAEAALALNGVAVQPDGSAGPQPA